MNTLPTIPQPHTDDLLHQFLQLQVTQNQQQAVQTQALKDVLVQLGNIISNGSQGQTTNRSKNIPVTLPKFGGHEKENVRAWTRHVHEIFEARGIEEEDQLRYLYECLSDGAYFWFSNRQQSENPIRTWRQFEEEVKTAFEAPTYQRDLRNQLRRIRQIRSVRDYVMQFRNIAGQIDDLGENEALTDFINGLKPATAGEVNARNPITLQEAINLAQNYDSAKFGASRPNTHQTGYYAYRESHRSTTTTKKEEGPTPMDLGKMEHKHYHTNGEANKEKTYRRSTGPCYACGEIGHFARNCKRELKRTIS
jgi:hypothetical protein